jgi:hypothetical protein
LSPVFASAGTKAPLNRQKNRQDDSWRERAGFGSHSVNDNLMQFHDPLTWNERQIRYPREEDKADESRLTSGLQFSIFHSDEFRPTNGRAGAGV